MNMPAAQQRFRFITLTTALSAVTMALSGCALFVKTAAEIVLQIGTDIAVQAGEDYLKSIFSTDDANGAPTITISHADGGGDGQGSTYLVSGFDRVTTANVTIRNHKGGVHIDTRGNGLVVTVDGGADATVAFTASGGDGSAASYNGVADQAASINGVLSWSSRSRTALGGAMDKLERCRKRADVDSAITTLNGIASDRGRQAAALADLDVSQLPGGDALRDTLVSALRASRSADLAFIEWGQAEKSKCGHDGNYGDGMDYSQDADVAKDKFTKAWSSIAGQYGLPRYKGTDI